MLHPLSIYKTLNKLFPERKKNESFAVLKLQVEDWSLSCLLHLSCGGKEDQTFQLFIPGECSLQGCFKLIKRGQLRNNDTMCAVTHLSFITFLKSRKWTNGYFKIPFTCSFSSMSYYYAQNRKRKC